MSDQISFEEKEIHRKLDGYIQKGAIEVLDDNGLPADYDFIYQNFPWRGEYIHWEIVPNSEYYQVRIPYKPEESRDFTERMIKERNLKGPVVLYGNVVLQCDYRMDISLLPSVMWDFMAIPVCLFAVNPDDRWCFSFNNYDDLNFGFAPEI